MTEVLIPLPKQEAEERATLEAVVTDSLKLVSENLGSASDALKIIQEKKLYRSTHSTFQAYCIEIWGREVSGVNKAIKAISVRRQILDSSENSPHDQKLMVERVVKKSSASAIMEIAKVKAEKRVDHIIEANRLANGKKMTAATAQKAISNLSHRPITSIGSGPKRDAWASVYGSAPRPDVSPAIQPEINNVPCGTLAAENQAPSMTFGQLRQVLKGLQIPDSATIRSAEGTSWRPVGHAKFDQVANLVSFW